MSVYVEKLKKNQKMLMEEIVSAVTEYAESGFKEILTKNSLEKSERELAEFIKASKEEIRKELFEDISESLDKSLNDALNGLTKLQIAKNIGVEADDEITALEKEILKLLGFSDEYISIVMDKDKEEILKAIAIIDKLGLFDWWYEDIGLSDLLNGRETQEEYTNLLNDLITSLKLGTKSAHKTEILLRYAKSDSPIIIIGETGTGKDLLANAIHKISNRKNSRFTAINSAELSENLFESEMFGHIKGAFTGANSNKEGLLQLTNGGTFFLDELGKMPKALQAKLLRVIENKTIKKVGGDKFEIIDIRFIVALQQKEIEKGKVLPDLLARLKYPDALRLPNIKIQLKKYGKTIIQRVIRKVMIDLNFEEHFTLNVENDFIDYLVNDYEFTLNYRELENIIHHAIMHRDQNFRNYLGLHCISELIQFNQNSKNNKPKSCVEGDTTSQNSYPTIMLSDMLSEKYLTNYFFLHNKYVNMILDFEQIKFSEIISIVENLEILIVQAYVIYIHNKGVKFKKAIKESDPNIDYVGYMQKISRLLKMNVKKCVNNYLNSSNGRQTNENE